MILFTNFPFSFQFCLSPHFRNHHKSPLSKNPNTVSPPSPCCRTRCTAVHFQPPPQLGRNLSSSTNIKLDSSQAPLDVDKARDKLDPDPSSSTGA